MVFPKVVESEGARFASDYIYRIPIIETDGQDQFCFGCLPRRERRIQLILPNVDQPNEARTGVVVQRPICTEWLQRAVNGIRDPVRMPSNRMEHDRITVANVAKCWTKRFHPEWLRSRIAEYNRWLTPNEGDLTRWDANHVFLLLLFSNSSGFKTKNRKL